MNGTQTIWGRLDEQRREVEDKLRELGLVLNRDYIFESISLQGSQNYGTDTYKSDVDSKYSLIPTVHSLLRGTDFTRDLTVSRNEKVSVKSFPDFVSLFFKGNVNNLEMLFTDYALSNHDLGLMYSLRPYREEIVEASFGTVMSAMVGMAMQKQKSMFKGTESTQTYVDKLGYDPKDCAHILRLCVMLRRLAEGEKFSEALIMDKNYISMRDAMYTGVVSADGMTSFVASWVNEMKQTEARLKETKINHPEKIQKLKEVIAKHYESTYTDYLQEEVFKCNYCN